MHQILSVLFLLKKKEKKGSVEPNIWGILIFSLLFFAYVFVLYCSKVMSGWSVNLSTLFLGRLRSPKPFSTSCTYFRQ